VIQAVRDRGMLPACPLPLSHVATSCSSLHLIGDTYLDLFACGGCGYRLSLVTETPTPYVALGRETLRMSVKRLVPVRGFCRDGAAVARGVQWLADSDVSTDSNSTSLHASRVTSLTNDVIMWNTGAERTSKL
jgi:hypothetical protein